MKVNLALVLLLFFVIVDIFSAVGQTQGVTVSVSPTHTAWVDNMDPNRSHYDEDLLHVRAYPKTLGIEIRRTYYYFDLSNLLGNIISANLTIDAQVGGKPGTLELHLTSWNGSPITWNTAPSIGELVDSQYYDGGTHPVSFNVTSTLLGGHPNNTISYVLKFEDENPSSDEHCDHKNPRLEITLETSEIFADLEIKKTGNPDPVAPGDNLTYTLTITNHGPNEAENVVVKDNVSGILQDPEYSLDGGEWKPWNGEVNLGNMGVNKSIQISIRGKVDPSISGNVSNTAEVTSNTSDPDPNDNSDTEETLVGIFADLEIKKTGTKVVELGGTIT